MGFWDYWKQRAKEVLSKPVINKTLVNFANSPVNQLPQQFNDKFLGGAARSAINTASAGARLVGANNAANKMQSFKKTILPEIAPTNNYGRIGATSGNIAKNVAGFVATAPLGFGSVKALNALKSPTLKLLGYSGLRGLENTGFGMINRAGETGSVGTGKDALKDFGMGAALNTALSPRLLGKSAQELYGNAREIARTRAIQEPLNKLALNLSKTSNRASINKFINESPVTRDLAPQTKKSLAGIYERESNPEKIFQGLKKYLKSPTDVNVNYYKPGTQPGFIKLPNGKYTTDKIPDELMINDQSSRVYEELSNAQAGQRFSSEINGQGSNQDWIGQKSSFPQWVPQELRKRDLFDKVQKHLIDGTVPATKREADLYDVIHDRMRTENGLPGVSLGDNTPSTPKTETRPLIVKTEKKAIPQVVEWPKDKPIPANSRAQELADALGLDPKDIPVSFPKKKDNILDRIRIDRELPEITQEQADNLINTATYRAVDKNQRKGFYKLFDEWIGKREVAKTVGAESTKKYNVPFAEAKGVIDDIENGIRTNKYANNITQAYDDLFKVAETLGKKSKQDIAYRQNYLTHIWKQTPEQIEQIFQKLGKKFSFANPREIPTYAEGIKMGLTPKYSNPAQMIGEYVQKLNQTEANINFFNKLRDQGFIVPGSLGRRAGFVPVNAEGFPVNTTKFNGESFTGGWYAPKEIANEINKVFNPQDTVTIGKIANIGAKISGGAQDILLSGGIPKTPINAFTIAQTTKEILAGRVKSPIMSMIRSLDGNATQKFFQENVPTIKKMQERNIPFSSEFDIENIADRGTIGNLFGKSFGEFWSKSVNNPTFKRFMPMLQVNLFNDIEQSALKAGKGAGEAADIAAQAIRNFYGVGSTGKAARASKLGKDALQAILFAPRYRESMVNFWVNNVKSLWTTNRSQLLANKSNLSFIVGATVTLMAMNKLNQDINGHPMSENPEGKTDKLLIPLGDGTTVGIPFLSSIATIPRAGYNLSKDLVQGDFKAAGKELSGNISMAARPVLDVFNNENYFGSEIYKDEDTAGQKLGKSAQYIAKQYMHPYIREGLNTQTADKILPEGVKKFLGTKPQPLYQTLSKSSEMPLRFYNTQQIKDSKIWDQINKQAEDKSKDNKSRISKYLGGDKTAFEGLTNQQKSSLVRSAREQQAKEGLTSLEKKLFDMSQENRDKLLASNQSLAPTIQKVELIKSSLSSSKKVSLPKVTLKKPRKAKVAKGLKAPKMAKAKIKTLKSPTVKKIALKKPKKIKLA